MPMPCRTRWSNPAMRHRSTLTYLTRDLRLSELATPTLVIWSREDKVNKPAGARMLARRMPNADILNHRRDWTLGPVGTR